MLVATTAQDTAGDGSATETAKLHLHQLLANPTAAIAKDKESCPSGAATPTVQTELAAILLSFADGSAPMTIATTCEPADAGKVFCTFTFSVTAGEDQASAGFTYLAEQDGRVIDIATLACFHTP